MNCKKIFSFLVCAAFSSVAFAQNNLVNNPGFEDITDNHCPTLDDWSSAVAWIQLNGGTSCGPGTSDYHNSATCGYTNEARTGTGWTFCLIQPDQNYYEYITEELLHPLTAGHKYYVSFYVQAKESPGNLFGAIFTSTKPDQPCSSLLHPGGLINRQAAIENPATRMISPADGWVLVSGYYIAQPNDNWITIGNFNTNFAFPGGGYIFDDVKVYEISDGDCPSAILNENFVYDDVQLLYQASDHIYAGQSVNSNTVDGIVEVTPTANITYKAGKEVGLFDGFGADRKSEFHAYIAPCGSDCTPPAPVAGANAEICDGTSYRLGGPSIFGMNYVWTSDPAGATSYLSSTTISDPVFTPPPSGDGTITYSVTATNQCGQSSTNSVTLHYDDNPSSTVQLSLTNVNLGDLPSFDVNYDSHVKTVLIEVLDQSLSTVYYSSTYEENIDFTCCSFSWQLPVGLSNCIDYRIRVTATNYCTGATSSQVLDWNRNRTFALTAPLPNVVTPTNAFCMQFTGGAFVSLTVHTPAGNNVFVINQVPIYAPEACLWAGECNQAFCSNPFVVDGTYYYDLTVYDCNMAQVYNTAGYMEVLLGYGRYAAALDSPAQNSITNGIKVFPNPAKEKVTIVNLDANSTVRLVGCEGQLIRQEETSNAIYELNLDGIAPGVYFIEVQAGESVQREKLIVY